MISIQIRPARSDDAPLAAQLFRLSMGGLASYLFKNDSDFAQTSLEKLFSQNAGRFGFKSAVVAETNEGAVGFLVSYPGADLHRLDIQTVPHLFSSLGFVRAFEFILRGISLPGGKEAANDEYYISNLGVIPASQGSGIGARLLEHADNVARNLHLKKCSLLVSLRNEGARRLYERNGYHIVETVLSKNDAPGYHRMVKELA